VTIDRWDTADAWRAFLDGWPYDYAALDRRCEELTVAEQEIGAFLRVI
jgi:hypothetical protein